jgi:3',5'-cyclic AMP phosphodiesterase CpdA
VTPPLIAQLSDPHLRLDDEATHRALSAAVERVLALRPLPSAVLLTGDIANSGDPQEHALADALLAPLPMPVHRVAGNHDLLPERTEFAVEAGGLRLIGCDTSVHGRDDGALDVGALAARLDEDRSRPTIVAMHHPPFDVGLPWLDEIGLPRADRDALAGLLARSPQVKRVVAGHVHRAIATTVGGVGAVTCASTNIQAALDFTTTEMALADEPPSFLVHVLLGEEIVTHVHPV